jgi:hypothetical protein
VIGTQHNVVAFFAACAGLTLVSHAMTSPLVQSGGVDRETSRD